MTTEDPNLVPIDLRMHALEDGSFAFMPTVPTLRYVTVSKVIVRNPYVIAFVDDGKAKHRFVSRCADGDDFDRFVGLANCAIRYAGRNRVRYGKFEHVLRELSSLSLEPSELDALGKALQLVADAVTLDGYESPDIE